MDIDIVLTLFVDNDIFGDSEDYHNQQKIRFKKPVTRKIIKLDKKTITISTPNRFKKLSQVKDPSTTSGFDTDIKVDLLVMHLKFGRGIVKNIEGTGTNKKASIEFEKHGIKNLLLQFAKLKIVKIKKH